MTSSIEDYALIGNGKTAALVGRDGSIDWLCWPRFDSDACLAALLGSPDNGRWLIAPVGPVVRTTRRYQDNTLIVETEFETADGAVGLVDFLSIGSPASSVVRIVIGLRGTVAMQMELTLRFDFGRINPWVEACADGFRASIGPDLVVLRAPMSIEAAAAGAMARFTVTAGQRLPFVMSYGSSNEPVPSPLDAERAHELTGDYWREWIGRFDKPTHWQDAVRRSLLTLHALTHQPTGGLIAAPTTSLPEKAGGSLNWDYRFCWLRDSTFTLSALLNAGYHQEAAAWRAWILRAIAAEPAKLDIMYRVDGARHVDERSIDWLAGYGYSTPVRVGNAAAKQLQVDVYGELLDGMELSTRAGIPQTEHGRHAEREIVLHLEKIWNSAGQGLWESRAQPRHYTYSRVMAWVGVDRFLRSAARYGHADPMLLGRLQALRTRIHADVCKEGYHSSLGYFVQHYGGQELDASLLLLPIVGFLPANDPRIARTIAAIERDLMHDGLIFRTAQSRETENAFLACTCWLADCRSMQGRPAEAREALERVLAVRSDLGLLAEEYDTTAQQLTGNFPQALTHLGVINTALGLSGPVLQRGAG